jgi:hypothetical protein
MGSFIFVGIMCIANSCDFIASHRPISEDQCKVIKKQFENLPFKPEVTLVASQCLKFEGVSI